MQTHTDHVIYELIKSCTEDMTNFVEHLAFAAPPPLSPRENNAIFYFKKLIFVDRLANFKFSKMKDRPLGNLSTA